jgi:hypothetical protein
MSLDSVCADWLARRTSISFGFIDGLTLSLVFLPHSWGVFAIELNCSFLSIFISASNSGGLKKFGGGVLSRWSHESREGLWLYLGMRLGLWYYGYISAWDYDYDKWYSHNASLNSSMVSLRESCQWFQMASQHFSKNISRDMAFQTARLMLVAEEKSDFELDRFFGRHGCPPFASQI